jgi:hypothetical protein
MKIAVSWDVTLYVSGDTYKYFGGTSCLSLQVNRVADVAGSCSTLIRMY